MTDDKYQVFKKEGERLNTVSKAISKHSLTSKNCTFLIGGFPEFSFDRFEMFYYTNE